MATQTQTPQASLPDDVADVVDPDFEELLLKIEREDTPERLLVLARALQEQLSRRRQQNSAN